MVVRNIGKLGRSKINMPENEEAIPEHLHHLSEEAIKDTTDPFTPMPGTITGITLTTGGSGYSSNLAAYYYSMQGLHIGSPWSASSNNGVVWQIQPANTASGQGMYQQGIEGTSQAQALANAQLQQYQAQYEANKQREAFEKEVYEKALSQPRTQTGPPTLDEVAKEEGWGYVPSQTGLINNRKVSQAPEPITPIKQDPLDLRYAIVRPNLACKISSTEELSTPITFQQTLKDSPKFTHRVLNDEKSLFYKAWEWFTNTEVFKLVKGIVTLLFLKEGKNGKPTSNTQFDGPGNDKDTPVQSAIK